MKIYTGGSFEVPHIGHFNFLRQISQLGMVVVSLNTDEFIEKFKGHKPVFSYEERRAFLEMLPYVSIVIPNTSGSDSKPTIEQVKPDIIAIGSDWARRDYYKQMNFTQDWLDERGIMLLYVPYTKGISSTIIKERIKR
jgi:glycerol-3-phosphate cytidylyltransferase